MRKRLFPLLIALSALAVSGSAAFYSVFGLSKLFKNFHFTKLKEGIKQSINYYKKII